MSDEEKKKKATLVSTGNRGLATRSSGLAKRGLELLSSHQERTIYFPTDRSIGVLYVLGEDNKWIRIDARGKVTIPIGRTLGFHDGSNYFTGGFRHALSARRSGKPRIYDSDLICLQELAELQWLYLTGLQITDAGLVHLQGMTTLKKLYLTDTNISDAGLVHLKELRDLELLNVGGFNEMTDAGLVHLSGLTKLKKLDM